jgi:hypothetical protein
MDVKSVLIDRQTLKYKGGRVCPLPPPSAKPLYGGKAFNQVIKLFIVLKTSLFTENNRHIQKLINM